MIYTISRNARKLKKHKTLKKKWEVRLKKHTNLIENI